MLISAIICTYNRDKYLYNVLKSLADNDLSNDKYEIVVVDNNSTDNTKSEYERFVVDFPQVRISYCFERNQGLSYARNRGLDESKGDVVVYVDDDARVNNIYLRTYYEFFEKRPDCDAAGGPIIPIYESSEPKWISYYTRLLLTGYLYKGKTEKPFSGSSYPGGGNAAYRMSVFDKVGKFNVDLGRKGTGLMASEEKDIFDKMHSLGMKIQYLPDAVLYHIIPDYKLTDEHIVRLSYSIGQSERVRTKSISQAKYHKRVFMEFVKWVGTMAYWVLYFVSGHPQKGNKLILFRRYVYKGLLGKQ